MNLFYLLLGGNVDDRKYYLNRARQKILSNIGKIKQCSSIFETEPWGFKSEDLFLNQVVITETEKNPEEILNEITIIESELGRVRSNEGYSSRTIDIDILFFNNDVFDKKDLTIPHPGLHQRRFVLEPLNEIAPDYIHPVLKKSVSELLSECNDTLQVYKLKDKND